MMFVAVVGDDAKRLAYDVVSLALAANQTLVVDAEGEDVDVAYRAVVGDRPQQA